jgi:hypothetical protein
MAKLCAAAQAQCHTLVSGRKGSASAAFERKVFSGCAAATRTTIRPRSDDPSRTEVRRRLLSLEQLYMPS